MFAVTNGYRILVASVELIAIRSIGIYDADGSMQC